MRAEDVLRDLGKRLAEGCACYGVRESYCQTFLLDWKMMVDQIVADDLSMGKSIARLIQMLNLCRDLVANADGER